MRSELALAALASAAVPGMKPVSVAGIHPGDGDRELEIQRAVVEDATGRTWVVHSPLTPVAGARLQRHDELVRQLPRHVPFKVPAAAGHASVGKDGAAVVYPFIEGSPLDLGRIPAGQGLASAVGRTIAAVHNIPRAVFEAQDVPVFDAGGVRQRAISEVDRAAETGRVPTGLLARWEEAFESASLWQFATTPIHGSFRGSSLLVSFSDERDAATGRVVAVLNWDEASVGDPAADLAELYVQAAPAAWEAVLDAYALARAQRPDPYLHARARLVSELRVLRGLARAVEDGREDSVRRSVEALRRLDRLTEHEDSIVPVSARVASHQSPTAVAAPGADTHGDDAHGEARGHGADPVGQDSFEEEVAELTDGDSTAFADEDAAAFADEDPAKLTDEGAAELTDEDPAELTGELTYGGPAGITDEDAEPLSGGDVEDDGGDEDVLTDQEDDGHDAPAEGEGHPYDPDLTIEVPVAAVHGGSQELGGPERATSDDPSLAEASAEDGADEDPTGSPTEDEPGADLADRELADLDDEERLHELYGMPDTGMPDDATTEATDGSAPRDS